MSHIESPVPYAPPSPQVLRFLEGVRAYCVETDGAFTQQSLARAKGQIADALNRRSEQGVRLPLQDHNIRVEPESAKIKALRESVSVKLPESAHLELAGRVKPQTAPAA